MGRHLTLDTDFKIKMAQNVNQNQNQMQSAAQSRQMGNEPNLKPPEASFGEIFNNFGGPKIILAVLVITILAAALGFYYWRNLKPSKPEETQTMPPLASVIPGATPPQLPKAQEEDKKAQLREFFVKASPVNFKEVFLETLPEAAADAYIKYSAASSVADKQAAARGFYIILNNPGAPSSDPAFGLFVKDVRAALEKEIGKPLF